MWGQGNFGLETRMKPRELMERMEVKLKLRKGLESPIYYVLKFEAEHFLDLQGTADRALSAPLQSVVGRRTRGTYSITLFQSIS